MRLLNAAIVVTAAMCASAPGTSAGMRVSGDMAWARAPPALGGRGAGGGEMVARGGRGPARLGRGRGVLLGPSMVAAVPDDMLENELRARARKALEKFEIVTGWLKGGDKQREDAEYCLLPTSDDPDAREMDKGFCTLNPDSPAMRYDPDVLLKPSSPAEYGSVGLRLAQVVLVATTFLAQLARDELMEEADGSEKVKERARDLREQLTKLGPTFVKVGQVLANRPDIVRADYMEELTKLQDKVPPFSSQVAFKMMEKGLGRPVDEVFSEITPEPIAAASLGQVYRATLRSNGEEVAVKVQRPNAKAVIKRDLYMLRIVAGAFNNLAFQRLGADALSLIDEFAENLLLELDYQQEARNILDFQRNFEGDETVKIPGVYTELTSEKVIVMEWIDGVRCTDLEGLGRLNVPISSFIKTGVQSGMRQLLEFGLFHGDPHPGNVFALGDGRIAYVDFGSVAEISKANKESLIDAVVHAMDEDYGEIAQDLGRLGFLAEGTDSKPIAVALQGMWKDAMGQSIRDFNFRTVTAQFSKLAFNYPIRVPERFALVIRTLLTQEGICMTLDNDFKLLEVAYPYVAKRLLRDPLYSSRLPQVLLKDEPMSTKPVFNFRRSFSLIALAAAVAGKGPRGVFELMATVGDALTLVVRQPKTAMVLVKGMVRWARTKLLVFGIGAKDRVKVATRTLLRNRPESA